MTRATETQVDELHGLLAETLIEQITAYKRGEMYELDREGNRVPLPMPPALLAQAIKFLHDNGIDSPQRAQKVRDALAGRMPEFDPEDNVVAIGGSQCR